VTKIPRARAAAPAGIRGEHDRLVAVGLGDLERAAFGLRAARKAGPARPPSSGGVPSC